MECSRRVGMFKSAFYLEGRRSQTERENMNLEHISNVSSDLTNGQDRKEKIEEYVWKNMPEPRDQWEDWFEEMCEAALAIACHILPPPLITCAI